MKSGKIGKLEIKMKWNPKWNKKAKKWKKRIRHAKWLPKLYHKRKRVGDAIYSVMYLAANFKKNDN